MNTPPRARSTPVRQRRHRARKGEGELLRDEILAAAEDLLAEHGTKDAVTIRAVAAKVGVTPPAIYLHFTDKDDLFYECCRRNFARLNEALVEAVNGVDTVVERLARAGEAYIRFGLSHPGQYLTLFGGTATDLVPPDRITDDPGVHAFQLLVDLLADGVGSGELRPDLEVDSAAVAVWAAVHGTVMILLTKRGLEHLPLPEVDDAIAATVRMILSGIEA